MSGENFEGQISFLGLLEGKSEEFEVVKKPQPPKRVKPVLPKAPEQFKLDFIDLDAEYEAEHKDPSDSYIVGKPVDNKATDNSETEVKPLFEACSKCWCRDCKHNSRNEGVPRDICGTMMACPCCDGCVAEDNPTVCEIGNATEGCKTRAIEEGILEIEVFE